MRRSLPLPRPPAACRPPARLLARPPTAPSIPPPACPCSYTQEEREQLAANKPLEAATLKSYATHEKKLKVRAGRVSLAQLASGGRGRSAVLYWCLPPSHREPSTKQTSRTPLQAFFEQHGFAPDDCGDPSELEQLLSRAIKWCSQNCPGYEYRGKVKEMVSCLAALEALSSVPGPPTPKVYWGVRLCSTFLCLSVTPALCKPP